MCDPAYHEKSARRISSFYIAALTNDTGTSDFMVTVVPFIET